MGKWDSDKKRTHHLSQYTELSLSSISTKYLSGSFFNWLYSLKSFSAPSHRLQTFFLYSASANCHVLYKGLFAVAPAI